MEVKEKVVMITKRDGREEKLNRDKIENAIESAFQETDEITHTDFIYDLVTDIFWEIVENEELQNVESIQDLIEFKLMDTLPKTAKAYILYRDKRTQLRNKMWDMNELQRDIYDSKYRYNKESFNEFIDRVSGGNKAVGGLIRNKDFSFGGRILAGRGLDRNITLSNCYVLPQPEDNIESIFDTAKYMARTYSFGGGVGIDLSNLRPIGAKVNNAALTTSGPVSFMDLYDTTTSVIGQRGRRGALMISMSTDHKDINEFIKSKSDVGKINHANISVRANDEFFRLDTPEKTETLNLISENNWRTGEPGMLFWDRVKDWHLLSEHPEYELVGVNPCLVGDTLIQTVEGSIPIKDLVGKKPYVYAMGENGELTIQQASKVWLTKKDAKLVKVSAGKGDIICTPNHKIFTTNRGWVMAKNLNKGDKIKGLNRKTDGYKWSSVCLSGGKYEREHRFVARHFYDIDNMNVHHIDNNGHNNKLSNLEILTHSEHSRISNLGREIKVNRDELGRFAEKENKIVTRKMESLGKQVGINWFVKSVEYLDYTEDVYDMTVPGVHNFIANNMVVHNCGEQPLPGFGNCLLGSINLSNFVIKPYTDEAYIDQDRLVDAIKIAVEGLNEVLHEGIPLHPLKEQRDTANNFRQIGLGIMGLADMFVKLGVEYGSKESGELSSSLGSMFRDVAIEKSVELTDKYGTYPKYDYDIISKSEYFKSLPEHLQDLIKENGMANSHLLSIAPTGSISTLFGISGGIEPIFANSYTRTTKSLSGTGDVDYKVYTNVIEELMNHKGITSESELPEYCITSHDIRPINRVKMQGVWQKYIDSAISSTINLKEESTVEDIENIYKESHKHGLKGVTVFRDGCFRVGILNVDTKEETKMGHECPECGGNLMMVEGCNTCQDCGWGQCSI